MQPFLWPICCVARHYDKSSSLAARPHRLQSQISPLKLVVRQNKFDQIFLTTVSGPFHFLKWIWFDLARANLAMNGAKISLNFGYFHNTSLRRGKQYLPHADWDSSEFVANSSLWCCPTPRKAVLPLGIVYVTSTINRNLILRVLTSASPRNTHCSDVSGGKSWVSGCIHRRSCGPNSSKYYWWK